MRLAVVYNDIPFPPTRGGRADLWRRLIALKRSGVSIQLVHWKSRKGIGDGARISVMQESLDSVVSLDRPIGVGALFRNGCDPLWTRQFDSVGEKRSAVIDAVHSFRPDLIWVEGPWAYRFGQSLANHLRTPLIYRSQNIEHQYMIGQIRATRNVAYKLWMRLMFWGLASFETCAIRSAAMVFDISCDDMKYWQGCGIGNIEWLPPISEVSLENPILSTARGLDAVFLGNLQSPNNIAGIYWLLDSVWPLVRQELPEVRLVVAGSNPVDSVRQRIHSADGVDLLENVENASELMSRAKVLINPVMTGSGIQLKTVEMLMMPGAIVSTTQGCSGLPESIRHLVAPVDDAQSFARRVVDSLRNPSDTSKRVEAVRTLFSSERIVDTIQSTLKRVIDLSK